jgi:ubiquinone/menaquinone biosynthesis C-methylase UbiE
VWDREVLGTLLDHGMKSVDPLRARLLGAARGRVLEIGFGTGANLRFYPAAVESLVAVEPSEGFADTARARLAAWGRPSELVVRSAADRLPLDAASFDSAVVTFVLCSVRDPVALLRETARLLRPGAPILLAEHVAAPDRARRAAQRAIRPAWKVILGGCDPMHDARRSLREAGLDDRDVADEELEMPWVVSSGIAGAARSAG